LSTGTEYTGKSVEAATVAAEEALGKPRADLEIQVLSQGSRGVFGLGGEPARVLARDPSAPDAVEPRVSAPTVPPSPPAAAPSPPAAPPLDELPQAEPAREPAPVRERRPRPERHAADGDLDAPKVDIPNETIAQSAREILDTLLTKMGFEVEVEIRPDEEPVTLDVKGENLGILIGRRGDSLTALQFMVNVILSKEFRTWPRVVIDVQGYRARREQSLSSLAQRVAERVRRNRRPFTLEAMPANDRRIIHLSLRDRSDVETYSIGEGQSRRVVIAPNR